MNLKPANAQGKKKNLGVTLIELAIGLAVIITISLLALRGSSLMGKSKGVVEGQNVLDTATAVEQCFRSSTDYTALGATAVTGTTYVTANCPAEVANPPSSQAAGAITNQFGGARTVARASVNGGANNAITVSDAALPTAICQEVVQNQWSNFMTITVTPAGGAAVVVKAALNDVFAPAATATCSVAATATVAMVKVKN